MAVRNHYQCDTLFVMSGVAIRLARKMGLHKDGTFLGLSPFETELRRRLWWHLVHVDIRTADLLGTRPSWDLSYDNTLMPLNVEDEDLDPDMAAMPPERNGITSMAFCLIRCELMETLRKFSPTGSKEVRWETLYSPHLTLAKKDSIISQFENEMETKYLRYCDPTNSLHTFVLIMIRGGICKMRLFAHSPRQFANRSTKVPQSERDIVFANATKMLEYVTLMQGGVHNLEKYTWQIGTSYLWNAMLYVLIEARHRKFGPEVEKAFDLIGVVLSHYPQVFEENTGPVFTALGKWTLEVWDHCLAAATSKGLSIPTTPDYIHAIRRYRGKSPETQMKNKNPMDLSALATQNAFGNNILQPHNREGNAFDSMPLEIYDFSSLSSFEMDSNGWEQWEQLVADESNFMQAQNLNGGIVQY
jgi:hypothetical protein